MLCDNVVFWFIVIIILDKFFVIFLWILVGVVFVLGG